MSFKTTIKNLFIALIMMLLTGFVSVTVQAQVGSGGDDRCPTVRAIGLA